MSRNPVKEKENKITYQTMFWLFMLGSVLGFILEGIWHIIRHGTWANHSATVWGPFCIIYGIAAMLLYVLSMYLKKRNAVLQFFVCAAVGMLLEYFASLFQELCFGSISWNYSKQFLNLGGRVSFRMTILWGILGVCFVNLLYPLLSRVLAKITGKIANVACLCLSAFMTVNLVVTSAAVLRWGERLEDVPAGNFVEEKLDERFDNEAMEEIFPNMVFVS